MSSRLSPALAAFADGRWPDERRQPRGLDLRDLDQRQRHARQEYPHSSRRDVDPRGADSPTLEPPLHPSEIDRLERGRRPARRRSPSFIRLAIVFCAGAVATLAWQSYGNAARRMAARLSPGLGWLAPPPAVPSAMAAGTAPDQLHALSRSLAAVRQSVDRLTADIAKLQAATAPDVTARASSTPVSLPPSTAVSQGRKQGTAPAGSSR